LVIVTVPAAGSVASTTTGSEEEGPSPGLELTVPPLGTEPSEVLLGELGSTSHVTDGGVGSVMPSAVALTVKVCSALLSVPVVYGEVQVV
jgi:hypothetical protein